MRFEESLFERMKSPISSALAAMAELERGGIANPSENRMVGHYWLRTPELAPTPQIRDEIKNTIVRIKKFASDVHNQKILPQRGDGFFVVLVVGIGGSALGAQFVCDALGGADDPMMIRFVDNTDPDGIDRTLAELEDSLEATLTIVISKSGATVETRNGMLEVAAAYRKAGLHFADHAVAVTCEGSLLDQRAVSEKWLARFPMWDWVGGRTSVLSAVGLLPIALQGIDIDGLLAGARDCDAATRTSDIAKNPAALMSMMWHDAIKARGRRSLVVLPYRDRLSLLGKYLQQLIMESLGKGAGRKGQAVTEGLTVLGNKGSTDQHSFVQQLRDGVNDFFVTFVEVLRDRAGQSMQVEQDVTSGDFLHGFLHGTRDALYENDRESMLLTLDDVSPRSVGALIALFERTVGLYAELVDVNAYDQPGVEAGKKAAAKIIDLQRRALAHLRANRGKPINAQDLAAALGEPGSAETVLHILTHFAVSGQHGVESKSEVLDPRTLQETHGLQSVGFPWTFWSP